MEVFLNTNRREALLKETSIHIAEITAIKMSLKEIYNKKDKQCKVYRDWQNSMQSIEFKKRKPSNAKPDICNYGRSSNRRKAHHIM